MKRALIIGIDDYPSKPLNGCVNDAKRMSKVLSHHNDGTLNFECKTLIAPTQVITRPAIRKAISELFGSPADIAFLHYSGHGLLNGIGGYLVTPDSVSYDVGISMSEVLSLANDSEVKNIFITLDCCNSGAFGEVPELKNDRIILSEGVSIITATRDNQASLEEGGGGVFTSLLVEALDGGAAGLLGEVTAASAYAYIDNAMGAWGQRPMFKSNVSQFIVLRNAKPCIEHKILKKVIDYFPLPAEELPLGPEYEAELEPRDMAKETIFRDLQKMRYAGLVEPVGEEHMYFAAKNSKSCKLTKLGRYYWRLIRDNKL
ncbi:MAG: caspase family protein [Elusimicrobiota bacterium]